MLKAPVFFYSYDKEIDLMLGLLSLILFGYCKYIFRVPTNFSSIILMSYKENILTKCRQMTVTCTQKQDYEV